MSNLQYHILQYEHNLKHIAHLERNPEGLYEYADWIITSTFYCALHIIDKYILNNFDVKSYSHEQRSRYILKYLSDYEELYNDYKELKKFSIYSRYKFFILLEDENSIKLTMENAKKRLNRIENPLL